LDRRPIAPAGAAAAFCRHRFRGFSARKPFFPFRRAAAEHRFPRKFRSCKNLLYSQPGAPRLTGAHRKLTFVWNAGAVCLAPAFPVAIRSWILSRSESPTGSSWCQLPSARPTSSCWKPFCEPSTTMPAPRKESAWHLRPAEAAFEQCFLMVKIRRRHPMAACMRVPCRAPIRGPISLRARPPGKNRRIRGSPPSADRTRISFRSSSPCNGHRSPNKTYDLAVLSPGILRAARPSRRAKVQSVPLLRIQSRILSSGLNSAYKEGSPPILDGESKRTRPAAALDLDCAASGAREGSLKGVRACEARKRCSMQPCSLREPAKEAAAIVSQALRAPKNREALQDLQADGFRNHKNHRHHQPPVGAVASRRRKGLCGLS